MSIVLDGTNGITTPSTANNGTTAVAWANFVGSSGTKNASYNVGTITRTGTGQYTVNFTNALIDANYVVSFSSFLSGAASGRAFIITAMSLSAFSFYNSVSTTGSYVDDTAVMFTVIR
jgi:hypothetical protein